MDKVTPQDCFAQKSWSDSSRSYAAGSDGCRVFGHFGRVCAFSAQKRPSNSLNTRNCPNCGMLGHFFKLCSTKIANEGGKIHNTEQNGRH